MGGYAKLLLRIGPVVLPLVISGIRYLCKRKKNEQELGEHDDDAKHKMIDTLVDTGLSAMTRGKGRRRF